MEINGPKYLVHCVKITPEIFSLLHQKHTRNFWFIASKIHCSLCQSYTEEKQINQPFLHKKCPEY